MKCMTDGLGLDGVCDNCGTDENTLWVAPHHLKPRTVLSGKYIIGTVIGEGGFGITYVGWDMTLSLKVAIKEYFPIGFVTRDSTASSTVHSFSGEKGGFYTKGRDRFIKEAQRLAKFFGFPGIVAVKDVRFVIGRRQFFFIRMQIAEVADDDKFFIKIKWFI